MDWAVAESIEAILTPELPEDELEAEPLLMTERRFFISFLRMEGSG